VGRPGAVAVRGHSPRAGGIPLTPPWTAESGGTEANPTVHQARNGKAVHRLARTVPAEDDRLSCTRSNRAL